MNNSSNNYLPFLLLFIQPIFMASNLVIARGGAEFVPPISLAFWRWLICFLILLPFTFKYLFKNYKSYKNELGKIFILGFLACGICGAFPFIAGKTTTIINMGIIYSSSPIFIILISTIFFKEKINIVRIFGVLICIFGVLAIIVKGDIRLLFLLKFTSGDLWMLGASIGWAFYTIYLFNWKSVMPILERFTIIAMFGAISLLPFFLLENIYISETNYDLNFLFWVLFAAISPSIIAFLLFNYVNNKLGASITGSVLYLYTVYGAVYGLLFFNETIELFHYTGTILVFIGIFLIKKKLIMIKKFNMYLLKILIVIFIIYFFILTFLYFFQRNLLYHPSENNYFADDLTVQIEEVKIETSDGIKLLGWFHKKNLKIFKTIIFFHGNAGSLNNRIHKINHFKNIDVNFLIIAWRGFSGNQGKPSEKGLYLDGKSAIEWLNKKGVKNEDIILYGESLGTAVATHLSQNNNFAGVILESPFTSMIGAAKNVYPYFPIRFLLKDKYESDKKIKNIKSPILIMHGEADKIVPFWMGKKIYELANEPKYFYFSEKDNHMMEYNKKTLVILKEYLERLN